ncbi:MAG TPA: DUF4265 domain-containing protein [Bryobacteraceae bacterium]|jgi:hypothetical protein|nr:DUF4265 domain-containing protein [Bryobacteraceae bacterium]
MADENYKKIIFELQQDEDGYPPDKWESLWAFETEPGLYCVDNIPFYVRGISSGDVISAEDKGGQLLFRNLVLPSSNSVFRLYVSDADDVQGVRDEFRALGCETELSNLPKLVAVEIPGKVDFGPVGNLLGQGAGIGRWEYEEGVLRHEIAI